MKYLFILLLCSHANADNYDYALQKASEAAYKQLKLEDMFKPLEERFVPKIVKDYIGIVSITKALIEKKIDYSWSF